jgi:transcription initiation factor TFIIH subunit 2
MNEQHYKELINENIPPPVVQESSSELVKMGFPKSSSDYGVCLCHGKSCSGYECPSCMAKICEIPCECPVCGIVLLSSAHLARSYHHLFPVKEFVDGSGMCFCGSQGERKCPDCGIVACVDCDVYIHDVLHNCPGCV